MAGKKQKDSNPSWSHKNDFPIEEVWNTNNTLAQLIVPRLQAFKALDKHGIQKMVDAFELMKYAGASHTEDEERTIKQGLDLFCKYFRHLWD